MKYTDFVNSIQGLVKVEATDKGITAIEFVSAAESDNTANAKQGGIGRETAAQESMLSNGFHSQKNAITEAACSQLQAYFDGTLREFDCLHFETCFHGAFEVLFGLRREH